MIKLKSLIPEGDKEDFMSHHKTGHISSDAYKRYEEEGGLSWLGNPAKYPKLLDKGMYGPYEVEFRQSGEKNQYVKHDADGNLIRLPDGNVLMMSPEEIRSENLPEEDESIVAFVDGKPIGLVSNEFGAVGVFVEKAYQKLGIGTDLLEKHIEQRPRIKSGSGKIGQMTYAGEKLTAAYYEKMRRKYGEDWFEKLKKAGK